MMNRIIRQFVTGCALLGLFACAECDAKGPVQVRGYYRKDGTYVAPYTRSAPGSEPKSSESTSSGSWTPPSYSPPSRPRTGYRTSARSTPRTAAAGSSLNDGEEPAAEDHQEVARSKPGQSANETATDDKTAALAAELEQQKLDAEAKQLADEEEQKASSRLKRIKQLIAEKKGVISSNMKDSLREIVKKYPETEAAKEAKKLLGK